MKRLLEKLRRDYKVINKNQRAEAKDLLKFIGPGLLVTIGFIDPGNWASNFAAGSQFGYTLLWIVTLSTIMLIILQHNVAHLGIVTGLCLSEATHKYLPEKASKFVLWSAIGASISTSLAEILGGAIALQMLFNIPIKIGALMVTVFVTILALTNSYKKIESYIIGFVSIIGLSFLYELFLVHINWQEASVAWIKPCFPKGSLLIIMSVLGAVVMPHNLFLHSEIIQSRKWNLKDKKIIEKQLKYEFFDTLSSMLIGWAINSAMILLAASVFFSKNILVTDLAQAHSLLQPLLGKSSGIIFGTALLLAGISSTTTSGIAAGSIFAGMYDEPYNIKDIHSRTGVLLSFGLALCIIFVIKNPFQGLILSQAVLSFQLPVTIFTQVKLTSSPKVMGEYANTASTKYLLYVISIIVSLLNAALLVSLFQGI